MGVKFGREYRDIILDFTRAMRDIEAIYEFLEMEADDWHRLLDDEKLECVQTLADDVFYGLGADPTLHVGAATIIYDKGNHIIKVFNGDNVVHVVNLI